MLITNHVLAGTIIGALSRSSSGAFAAGVVSHFALDAIPHWGARDDRHFLRTAVVDGLVGFAVASVAIALAPAERRTRVVAGIAGACAPDADKVCELAVGASPYPAWVDNAHARIQIESPEKLSQEIVLAAVLAPAAVATLSKHVTVASRRGPLRRLVDDLRGARTERPATQDAESDIETGTETATGDEQVVVTRTR